MRGPRFPRACIAAGRASLPAATLYFVGVCWGMGFEVFTLGVFLWCTWLVAGLDVIAAFGVHAIRLRPGCSDWIFDRVLLAWVSEMFGAGRGYT